MDEDRKRQVQAWAAWDDLAKDTHGTPEGVQNRAVANTLARDLGDFTDEDLAVIDKARRVYIAEAAS